MPIFGQVWLWSLAAFLLGTVLCWLLVVVPVRRRIDALESRLSSLRVEQRVNAAADRAARSADQHAEFTSAPQGFGSEGHDEVRPDTLTRAYALPGGRDMPAPPHGDEREDASERGALHLSLGAGVAEDRSAAAPTRYVAASGATPAGQRDWFDDQPAQAAPGPAGRLADEADEADEEDRGTIFTQRTTPIPRELIRKLDNADDAVGDRVGAHAAAEPAASRPEDSLVDDLTDDLAAEPAHQTVEPAPAPIRPAEPETPERARPAATLDAVFAVSNGTSAKPERSDVSTMDNSAGIGETLAVATSTVADLPSRPAAPTKLASGVVMQPQRAPSALPKRIPSKPQHRVPFGVATVTPATAPAATATDGDAAGERIRSLFEPIVPAEGGQSATPPPPHRLQEVASAASIGATGSSSGSRPGSPGPFGPGSAMPLPGGASPSPEFTVKASVTALRYCTPDTVQFGRMVAEVWFRSAADAERVGFRPVVS